MAFTISPKNILKEVTEAKKKMWEEIRAVNIDEIDRLEIVKWNKKLITHCLNMLEGFGELHLNGFYEELDADEMRGTLRSIIGTLEKMEKYDEIIFKKLKEMGKTYDKVLENIPNLR